MDLVAGPQGSGKSTFFPVAHRGHDSFNVDDRRRELNRGSSRKVPIEIRRRAIKEYGELRTHFRQIVSEEGEAFIYEYDMGDSWRHQVLVEEVGFESGNSARPLCLGGERACPPEDCGGVHGYYETLEILRDPAHEEYADTKIWIESMTGGPFDPDAFDVEAVNRSLKRFR
jgi:hypothetical protein